MDYRQELKDKFDKHDYDSIDFGCSKGTSIDYAMSAFGAENMLGIDIDPKKVDACIRRGYSAIVGDLTSFPTLNRKVKFSQLSHFLEHITFKQAEACIKSAVEVSEAFVYIQQPYFDADPQLFLKGLKLYWSDWRGHPNRMTSLQFHNILQGLKNRSLIDSFVILASKPIKNSDDKAIHSINSEIDSLNWDPKIHPYKPKIKFKFPVYYEIKVIISLNGHCIINSVLDRIKWDALIFDSRI